MVEELTVDSDVFDIVEVVDIDGEVETDGLDVSVAEIDIELKADAVPSLEGVGDGDKANPMSRFGTSVLVSCVPHK